MRAAVRQYMAEVESGLSGRRTQLSRIFLDAGASDATAILSGLPILNGCRPDVYAPSGRIIAKSRSLVVLIIETRRRCASIFVVCVRK